MSTAVDRPTAPAEQRDPAVPVGWSRLVANATFLLAGLLAAVQVLAVEFIPALTVFAAIYVAIGMAVRQVASRWPVVVALVFGTLHLVISYEFFAVNLSHPESPASFLTDAFVLLTGLALIVAAVLGLRRSDTRSRRPILLGMGVLALAAVVGSLLAAAQVESDPRQPDDVVITAARAQFPAEVDVPAGDAALWVENQDAFHHTLLIDGTDVRAMLPGNTTARVEVTLAAGTYSYWCDVPGHDEMEGVLVVR